MTQQPNQDWLDELYKGSRRMIADLPEGRGALIESAHDEGWNDCIDHLAQRGMLVPEGWVAVPREPTIPMLDAAAKSAYDEKDRSMWQINAYIYAAMLAAAPKMDGK